MRAKTKIQKEVEQKSKKLRKITSKQRTWAYEKAFEKWVILSRNRFYCLECGHSWLEKPTLITALTGCTCPECKTDLTIKSPKHRRKQSVYVGFVTISQGMQVVRIAMVEKYCKKKEVPSYSFAEVMQHWIYPTGKRVFRSIAVRGMSFEIDPWVWGTKLKARNINGYKANARANINPLHIYPVVKILPVFRRNGFKRNGAELGFYDVAPQQFFMGIPVNSKAETLLKAKQYDLFYSAIYHLQKVEDNWSRIKICIRNNYFVENASDWFDLINMLREEHKDTFNPELICPENFHFAHQELVKKRNKRREKQRLIWEEKAEARRKIQQEKNEKLAVIKEKLLAADISFKDGDMVVVCLKTRKDYEMEGEMLNHCVANYYSHANDLILSARIDGQPIETVQITLNPLEIAQSRGNDNQPTVYHNRIVKFVQSKLPVIEKKIRERVSV